MTVNVHADGPTSIDDLPTGLQPIIRDLLADKALRDLPRLSKRQWSSIEQYSSDYAASAPNHDAKTVRERVSVLQMLGDAHRV